MSRVDAKLLLIALIGALRGFSALGQDHAERMPMGARLGTVSFQDLMPAEGANRLQSRRRAPAFFLAGRSRENFHEGGDC